MLVENRKGQTWTRFRGHRQGRGRFRKERKMEEEEVPRDTSYCW